MDLLTRFYLWPTLAMTLMACIFGSYSTALAQSNGYNGYKLSINDNLNIPGFTITNTSTKGSLIESVTIGIGDTSYNWHLDDSNVLEEPSAGTVTITGNGRTDNATINFTNFHQGKKARFALDVDLDTGNSSADYRQVIFGNDNVAPPIPASEVHITFSDGQSESFTLTEDGSGDFNPRTYSPKF